MRVANEFYQLTKVKDSESANNESKVPHISAFLYTGSPHMQTQSQMNRTSTL